MMSRENIDLIIPVIKKHQISTLDLTGGAPESHQDFCYLVEAGQGNSCGGAL